MNTLSVHPQPSAEGTFSQGPVPSHTGPQAEASPSAHDLTTTDERITRDLNTLNSVVPVACVFAGAALVSFPIASAVVLMFVVSAGAVWFLYSWATHRGDTEIGVSDTQGRDGGAN